MSARNISVSFRYHPKTTVKRFLLSYINRKYSNTVVSHVLENVSFDVQDGETFGIIGRNGAGKTTLARILCGILQPQNGVISIKGRILPLLGIGVGFNYELTGRDNIELHTDLYGQNLAYIRREKMDQIISFADIGKYVDAPVKYYSSGMIVRLGFAIAVHFSFEVLLLDEVLHVGDADFSKKCENKLKELRERRKTFILISHDIQMIKDMCKRVLYLRGQGEPHFLGGADEAVALYLNEVKK